MLLKICKSNYFYSFRITPPYLYVILFWNNIFRYTLRGPMAEIKRQTFGDDGQCNKYWWTNLVYVNNFYPKQINKEVKQVLNMVLESFKLICMVSTGRYPRHLHSVYSDMIYCFDRDYHLVGTLTQRYLLPLEFETDVQNGLRVQYFTICYIY